MILYTYTETQNKNDTQAHIYICLLQDKFDNSFQEVREIDVLVIVLHVVNQSLIPDSAYSSHCFPRAIIYHKARNKL